MGKIIVALAIGVVADFALELLVRPAVTRGGHRNADGREHTACRVAPC